MVRCRSWVGTGAGRSPGEPLSWCVPLHQGLILPHHTSDVELVLGHSLAYAAPLGDVFRARFPADFSQEQRPGQEEASGQPAASSS